MIYYPSRSRVHERNGRGRRSRGRVGTTGCCAALAASPSKFAVRGIFYRARDAGVGVRGGCGGGCVTPPVGTASGRVRGRGAAPPPRRRASVQHGSTRFCAPHVSGDVRADLSRRAKGSDGPAVETAVFAKPKAHIHTRFFQKPPFMRSTTQHPRHQTRRRRRVKRVGAVGAPPIASPPSGSGWGRGVGNPLVS